MNSDRVSDQAERYITALKALIRPGAYACDGLDKSPLIELSAAAGGLSGQKDPHVLRMVVIGALEHVLVDELKAGDTAALAGEDREYAQMALGMGRHKGVGADERLSLLTLCYYEKFYGKVYDEDDHKRDSAKERWKRFRQQPLTRLMKVVIQSLYLRRAQELSANGIETFVTEPQAQSAHTMPYMVESYEVTQNVPEAPDKDREVLEVRKIKALKDGVAFWQGSSRHWGVAVGEAPKISLFGDATLEIAYDGPIVAESPGRAYMVRVHFPQPLARSESAKFALIKRLAADFDGPMEAGWQDRQFLAPTTDMAIATINVRFSPQKLPTKVWHYEDIPDWLAPGEHTATNALVPSACGFVTFTWREPRIGYSYGITWEW